MTPSTGELRPLADGRFEARIRIDDNGTRRGFALTGVPIGNRDAARERCTAMARIAVRVRRAGFGSDVEDLLRMAAKARPGRPWEGVLNAVEALCAGTTEEIEGTSKTFVDFAREWTSGNLHTRFPDHVGKKKDPDADEAYLTTYVEPVIGDLRIDAFGLDHADQIMASVPEGRASSTRRHVAQFVRRVCSLAVYPARLRKDNPIPKGWLPKVKVTKAFTHLHPNEDRALLGCVGSTDAPGVPLIRRLFYGVLAREGLRRGELGGLRFRDLDLDAGRISLDENKTDDPRSWALDPGVRRALKKWRDVYRADAAGDDFVFAEQGVPLNVNRLAEELQGDLKTAKVKREQLFERSANRRPIRVHDLRATFVTVSLANGRTETFVADRTGHRSSAMINRYRRAARTWSELDLGPLAPLDEAIPELRGERPTAGPGTGPRKGSVPQGVPHTMKIILPTNVIQAAGIIGGEEGIRTPGRLAPTHDFQTEQAIEPISSPQENRGESDPTAPEIEHHGALMGHSTPSSFQTGNAGDDVERALSRALEGATIAGRWDVVAQLATELRERRLERSGVVDLDAKRRSR